MLKNATFGTFGRSPGSPASKTCRNTGHLVSKRRKKKLHSIQTFNAHSIQTDQEELNQTSAEEQRQQPCSSLAPSAATTVTDKRTLTVTSGSVHYRRQDRRKPGGQRPLNPVTKKKKKIFRNKHFICVVFLLSFSFTVTEIKSCSLGVSLYPDRSEQRGVWKPAATEAASAAAAVGSRSSGLRPACSQRSVQRGEEGEQRRLRPRMRAPASTAKRRSSIKRMTRTRTEYKKTTSRVNFLMHIIIMEAV